MAEYIKRTIISLQDSNYFCNRSWTLSFNMNTKSWISFHSYIPNWYMGENNFFYSGMNNCCEDFDFIAATLIPSTTTTTSTTMYIPTDCALEGVAERTDCILEGILTLYTTTTTTSTTIEPTTTTTTTIL